MTGPEIAPLASPPTSTPWVPLWPLGGQTMGELAYAERTTTVTTAGEITLVTAPAVTLDGATPIQVEFFSPLIASSADQGGVFLRLYDNGVDIGYLGAVYAPGPDRGTPVRTAWRGTPAAGSHAFSVSAQAGSGVASVTAGAGGATAYVPAFIRVSLVSPVTGPAGSVVSGGGELAYAQSASSIPVASTNEAAPTDIVALPAVTLDGATPVLLEFFAPVVNPPASDTAAMYFQVFEGATMVGRLAQVMGRAAADAVPVFARYRFTPTAGAHTYKVTASKQSGTATVSGNTGGSGAYVPINARIIRV